MRRIVLAWLVVFVTWGVLDFVIHGVILGPTYASQPEMWRPQAEMKLVALYLAVATSAFVLTWLYARFVSPKSIARGAAFGTIWGVGIGIGMGYGTYAVMPIPYHMALVWFVGTVVEALVAGLIIGAVVRD